MRSRGVNVVGTWALIGAAALASAGCSRSAERSTAPKLSLHREHLLVSQLAGHPVYWVLPGPRHLDPDAKKVEGFFVATYTDRAAQDPASVPQPSPEARPEPAAFDAEFSDPAGTHYRVLLKKVLSPPIPGYTTDAGVLTHGTHHGATVTGTALEPELRTKVALWGVGELYVRGELRDKNRMMHVMVTEPVRNQQYHLVFNRDLPLPPTQRIRPKQENETHLLVMPIVLSDQGPVFRPVPTAYRLPNGKMQPFIHVMFEAPTVE